MEQNLQTDDKNRKEYPLTDIVKLDATLTYSGAYPFTFR